MNTFRTITTSIALLLSFNVFAQYENAAADLNFKLQLMDDNETWGVFVVPGASIAPTKRTNTGSGQVTIVAPLGFSYTAFENEGGTWVENARVDGPMESPDKSYISFGFVTEEPKIKLFPGEGTLLFTFVPTDREADFSLIDNVNDPFAAPNTYSSNPGNDLGVLDFGNADGMMVYAYGTNLDVDAPMNPATFASKKTKNGNYKAVLVSE